jgi:hypothetical protein
MARQLPRGGPPGRFGRARHTARRLWPVALEAWRRWDNLSPQQKERYRRMAGDYARRGRETLSNRRGRRGGRYGR